MKKIIIGLFIVVSGFTLFIVPKEFEHNEIENSMDKFFSGQIFDYANENYTVHGMGISPEEKVLTVRISKAQYKKQTERYFRDMLNSHNMESYELEVFADNLTLQ